MKGRLDGNNNKNNTNYKIDINFIEKTIKTFKF